MKVKASSPDERKAAVQCVLAPAKNAIGLIIHFVFAALHEAGTNVMFSSSFVIRDNALFIDVRSI